MPARRRRYRNALNSTCSDPDRGGRLALAGQSLHTNAGNDQVHLECGGGDRCRFVATEYLWTIPLTIPNPRWSVSKPNCKERGISCAIETKEQIAPDAQRQAHKFAAMEARPMKVVGVLSVAALFLLLGAIVPAFGQDEHQPQAKPEAKPAQHEEEAKPAKQQEQAKPEKQQEPKPAKQENEAKSAKKEPAAKPAKQENEAKSAKKEPAVKQEKQENEAESAKKDTG